MNPRYSIIPAGAVTDPNIEPRDLQALCLLGRHIDDLGWCRRSQVKMAREIGCARSTIQGSIDRLIAAGWLEKRPEESNGKGDTAHSYRVILDPNGEEPFYRNRPKPGRVKKVGNADGQTQNPADGSAPPPPADLSAPPPVPIQERHPVPIYGSAPLTSPVEREEEREGAPAFGQEERAPLSRLNLRPAGDEDREAAFRRLVQVYPAAAVDDEAMARREWGDVDETEWQEAVDAVPRMMRARKDIRRSTQVGLEKYIRNRQWKLFPQPAKAPDAEPAIELKPYVVPLWAMFWGVFDPRGKAHGAKVGFFLERIKKGLVTPAAAVPQTDEANPLVPVKIGSPAHLAWVTHCERLGVKLPRPDAVPVIYVPTLEPPASLPMRWKGYRLGVPQRLGVRSRAWWWRLFQEGAPIAELLNEGRKSEGSVLVEFGPWPAQSDLADMIEINRGSLQWEAWEQWFWKWRGDLRLWHESSIWCPGEYPAAVESKQEAGAVA